MKCLGSVDFKIARVVCCNKEEIKENHTGSLDTALCKCDSSFTSSKMKLLSQHSPNYLNWPLFDQSTSHLQSSECSATSIFCSSLSVCSGNLASTIKLLSYGSCYGIGNFRLVEGV